MEKKKKLNKNEVIDIVIDNYLASDEIYPDVFIKYYYNSIEPIDKNALITYSEISNINKNKYNAFLITMNERRKIFNERLRVLSDYLTKNIITPFDIELIMGTSLKSFKTAIKKKEVIEEYSKSYVAGLLKICESASTQIVSLEDALKIDYKYNGKKMSKSDIKRVYAYLQESHISTTIQNIIYAYEKQEKGELLSIKEANKYI